MSNFSVNSNHYLRNMYVNTDRALASSSGRAEASTSKLNYADSLALKKAINALGDFDYEMDESDVTESYKTKFSKELRAFVDSYNYTVESGKASSNEDINRQARKMQKFSEKHKDTLESLGVTVKNNGYLSYDNTKASSLYLKSFGKAFSSDSEYMQGISKYASSINNHVDAYV